MIISCGMGSPDEIWEAVNTCYQSGNRQVVLLKCCSEYPTDWNDMHLGNISDMKQRFGVNIGLSDHSEGSLGAVVGAVLGACVIEKHVKLPGIESADSDFSMEIDEFAQMVEDVKNAKLIAKGPDYSLSEKEKSSLVFRRSIFAVKDIQAGEKFTVENIRIIRPGYGIAPKYYGELIGKTAKRKIAYGEPVTEKDLL